MRFTASVLPRVAAGVFLSLSLASVSFAQRPIDTLADTVAQVEERLGARIGLSLVDTGSELSWLHREDERFLMNSTVKTPLCGTVLARRDAGRLSLSDTLRVTQEDILSYAPVTAEQVGTEMTLADLCLAALDMSDNTATNMLIDYLGGPQAVTEFFRTTGDEVSRLDRREPELNTLVPGDPRDTTTPAAMTSTLRRLLLGDVLSPSSRDQLAEWMSLGGVTGNLLRADAPDDWLILDKSGSGNHTRNIIAVITPDGGSPWIATIFISDTDADFATRNAALQEIGSAVISVIRN
ncbi:class A beta-lactamase [Qingshengfaniella alkalisoli]|uniref:Beta-lactamase n=1 Tax=Qingshengfaniella alkalisoli TaxID=2599296 RepID=A0A5B8I8Y7_9RHOB|nr:class A beta-lactamase [Qingshengfaniella alkalisoli]QDY69296.1 class A beta-lactamase [Qingshengfaniella alkalisoli]